MCGSDALHDKIGCTPKDAQSVKRIGGGVHVIDKRCQVIGDESGLIEQQIDALVVLS